jgi:hypothetical protein
MLPYGRWEPRRNPALGWRAIRIALDRPALLRYQVRALLMASAAARCLRILLPMVSDVDEFNRGARPDRPRTGAGPAAQPAAPDPDAGGRDAGSAGADVHAAAADAQADFVSIGSNDLLFLALRWTGPIRGWRALRCAQSRLADRDPPDRAQRQPKTMAKSRCAGRWRAGRWTRWRSRGLGLRHPYPCSPPDRPDQDDDPQPGHLGEISALWTAVRPDRSFPAHPTGRFRGRTGYCAEISSFAAAKVVLAAFSDRIGGGQF